MTGFEYDNVEACIGDLWKEAVSNPGHEQGLPIRPEYIDARTFVTPDAVEFKTDSAGEWLTAGECVQLGDVR